MAMNMCTKKQTYHSSLEVPGESNDNPLLSTSTMATVIPNVHLT
jgi:hypothetical protein